MMTIYTAIFGNYDELLPPLIQHSKFQHVCFTDTQLSIPGWEIYCVPRQFSDPARDARYYKILSHLAFPNEEYVVWVDGGCRPKRSLVAKTRQVLKNCDIAVFDHGMRHCIYEEAKVCSAFGYDDEATIAAQVDRYRQDDYPEYNGLFATGFVFRRHTPAIAKFNEAWWSEIDRGSKRDQLSLNYVLWKTKTPHFVINQNAYDSPWFEVAGHTREMIVAYHCLQVAGKVISPSVYYLGYWCVCQGARLFEVGAARTESVNGKQNWLVRYFDSNKSLEVTDEQSFNGDPQELVEQLDNWAKVKAKSVSGVAFRRLIQRNGRDAIRQFREIGYDHLF